MDSSKQMLLALRVLSAVAIVVGFAQIGSGLVRNMRLFGLVFPAWIPGAALALFGVRSWVRIDRLERKK